MNAPAHCIRGPSSSPRVDRVAQRAVGERPERAEVAHGREAGLDGHARVADAEQRVLGRRGGRRRDARRLDLADEVAVGVDEPGQDGEAAEVDDARAVGEAVVGAGDRLDAAVAHEERAVGQVRARLDVEQAPGADGD